MSALSLFSLRLDGISGISALTGPNAVSQSKRTEQHGFQICSILSKPKSAKAAGHGTRRFGFDSCRNCFQEVFSKLTLRVKYYSTELSQLKSQIYSFQIIQSDTLSDNLFPPKTI